MNDGQVCILGKIMFSTELGLCNIEVHGSDEDTAHFHITNNIYDIKLKIFYPEYYGDNNYILNDIEKSELQNFLLLTGINSGLPYILYPNMIIWNQLALTWSIINDFYSNYPEKDHIDEYKIPNYKEVK